MDITDSGAAQLENKNFKPGPIVNENKNFQTKSKLKFKCEFLKKIKFNKSIGCRRS